MSAPRGARKLAFSETELRRILLLPAARQLNCFLRFHLAHAPLEAVAQESGLTSRAVGRLMTRCRQQMGIERGPVSSEPRAVSGAIMQSLDYDSGQSFSVHTYIRTDRGYRFDSKQVEDYFLGPSLLRYRIAVLFWLEKLKDTEIAARLGLSLFKVKDQLRQVRRIATRTRPVKLQISHKIPTRRADGSTGSGPEQLPSRNFDRTSAIGWDSDRATAGADSNHG